MEENGTGWDMGELTGVKGGKGWTRKDPTKQGILKNVLQCPKPLYYYGFQRVLPIFRGLPGSCLTHRTCSCGPWTNLVMCIWPGSAAWLHTLAVDYLPELQ